MNSFLRSSFILYVLILAGCAVPPEPPGLLSFENVTEQAGLIEPLKGITSLSGGSLPVADGIVIALNRLNKIIELNPDQRIAVVPRQPNCILPQRRITKTTQASEDRKVLCTKCCANISST